MPGDGAGQERSGASREAARGGGGDQRAAQRTQNISIRGPGLRPGGERKIMREKKS